MRPHLRFLAALNHGMMAALLLWAGSVRGGQFTFGAPQVVSETRISRTVFEYTMRPTLTNTGAGIAGLSATVISTGPKTTVVSGAVSFGDVPTGLTTTSANTFVIRHDRAVPFDPAVLKWTLTAPPVTPVLAPLTSPTTATSVAVVGIAGPGDSIEVTGGAATATATANAAGGFSASVGVLPNRLNRLYVTSTNVTGQRSASSPLDVIQDGQAPSLFIDFPPDNATLTNTTITVAGRVGDMLSGFMGLAVQVNGQQANVDVGIGQNGTFERGGVPLALGANTIGVTATDAIGNVVSRQVSVTRVAITGPRMTVVSGDLQTGRIHSRLVNPILVRVTNADGSGLANKAVTFEVTRSDGRLAADGQPGAPNGLMIQTNTDATGLALAWWTLGGDAGCGNNRVTVTSRDIAGTTFFCASATPAPARQINVGSGNGQRAETGAPAPEALRAWVNDACNGVAAIPVTFTVVHGGGKVNGLDAITVNTSTTGHAEVRFTFGPDQGNNLVEATYAGNAGPPATFVCHGVGRDLTNPTTFTGLVLDNTSQPIGHALCEIFVPGNANPALLTYTDTEGRFAFPNPPTGPVHLFVYGASATTVGANPVPPNSFPFLTFPTTLIPNAENSLPTPVLLPRLNANNTRLYDGTTDLVLTCEGMAGLKMIIKANSMRKADGSLVTPQNKADVSLNQVHHDDVPMAIPDGAAPPFAWTLQPGRATFDPPIQIEYPNMTGLPAGSIAYFLSFNHDTERFEIVASGHVLSDGSRIVTDPGAGLTVAGWGCNCPPYSVASDCCKPTTNGCGAEGSGFKPPDRVPGVFDFGAACNAHDICYGTLGSSQAGCDNDFLANMLASCGGNSACAKVAYVYYAAVREFGKGPFDEAQEEARRCRAGAGGLISPPNPVNPNNRDRDDPAVVPPFDDNDGDLLPDDWELQFDLDPTDPNDARLDQDGDGMANYFEFISGNDPFDADTDDDGIDDGTQFMEENPVNETLDASWTVTVGGRSVSVDQFGSFFIPNVSAADLFGPGGPGTSPDFLSDDFVRLLGTSTKNGRTRYAFSEPFQVRRDQTFVLRNLTFTDTPPLLPESIRATVDNPTLTSIGQTTQLHVTARLANGLTRDATPRTQWTVYRTSNTAIVTVGRDGLLTAVGRGIAFITAVNEGATTVAQINVAPGDPLTTVSGFVRAANGAPVEGATIRIVGLGGTALTAQDGSFSISGVATTFGPISVTAQLVAGGSALVGRAVTVPPTAGGTTDAGLITLKPAVAWVSPTSGLWTTAGNWSTGQVPGPADDVFISAPGSVVVTHSAGNSTIQSLYSDNPVAISGGILTASDFIQANNTFTLGGGATIKGATFLPKSPLTALTATGGTLDGVTLGADLTVLANGSLTLKNGLTLSSAKLILNGNASAVFNGTQTLGGTGEVLFGGGVNATNYIYSQGNNTQLGTAILTIGAGVTVHGSQNGQLSGYYSFDSILNQGTISADTAGRTISLLGNWSNAGLIKPLNAGVVSLNGSYTRSALGTFDATGGTINLSGQLDNTGATLALTAATGSLTLAGGTIRGGTVSAAGGAALNLPNGTLDAVTLANDMTVSVNGSLTLKNGLTLSNTKLILNGNASAVFNGTQTLGGTGEVLFGGGVNATNYIYSQGNNTQLGAAILTIGAGITVHGSQNGQLSGYYSFDSILNQGTISADTAGRTISLLGNWSNTGLIKPLNGGVVSLNGSYTRSALGTFDATGGTINLTGQLDNTGATLALTAATGSLTLAGGTIRGGTVSAAGGAALNLPNGTLDAVTLANDMTVSVNGSLTLKNGLTLSSAKLILNGNASAVFNGTQTLGGTGEVLFAGGVNATNYIYSQGNNTQLGAAILTIGAGISVHGSQNGQLSGYYSFDSILNQGTISADTAGRTISLLGNWSNTGLIKPLNGGMVSLNGSYTRSALGTFDATGGMINVSGQLDNTGATLALTAATGSLTLAGGTIRGGTVSAAGGAALNLPNGTLDAVTLANDMTVSVNGSLTLKNGLTLSNTKLILNGNASAVFNGTQTLGGTGEVLFAGGVNTTNYIYSQGNSTQLGAAILTIGAGITVHGSQNGQLTGYYSFDSILNQGTISADTAGRSIVISGLFTNQGSVAAVDGTLSLNGTNWSGGAGTLGLSGNGVLNLGGTVARAALGTLNRSGGIVNVTGILDNTGTTLALNAATGSWNLSGGTIKGGTITGTGDASLVVTVGILDGVTLGSDLTVPANGSLTSKNGLTLSNANLILNGNVTTVFTGTQTLGGTGEMLFAGSANATSYVYAQGNNTQAGAAILTIGAGITVHGSQNGQLSGYYNFDSILNQGTISADTAARSLNLLGTPLTNQGTMRALNGGSLLTTNLLNTGSVTASDSTLALSGSWNNAGTIAATNSTVNLAGSYVLASLGTFNRSGGTVNVTGILDNTGTTLALNAATGSWNLSGGTIKGGTITGIGGASLVVTVGTLDGVTLGSNVTVPANGSLTSKNGLTLSNANLTLNGNVTAVFTGTQTLGGTGEMLFAGSANATSYVYAQGNNTQAGAAILTIGAGITVHGSQNGQLSGYYNFDSILNQGTISADTAARSLNLLGTPLTNQGTMRALNGGSLLTTNLLNTGSVTASDSTLALSGSWNNAGTIAATNSTVNLAGSYVLANLGTFNRSGGTVNVTGILDNTGTTLALNAATGSWNLSGGTIKGGTITGTGGASLVVTVGTLDGVTLSSDVTVPANGSLTSKNGLTLSNANLILNGNVTTVFTGTQTLGGTGEMLFAGSANATSYVYAQGNNTQAGAAILTIGAGITVHGSQNGQLSGYYNFDSILNQGTISADTAARSLNLLGTPLTNQGTMRALNGGSLLTTNLLNTGSVTASDSTLALSGSWNNAGTIAATNSTVNLAGSYVLASLGTFNRSGGTVNVTGILDNTGTTLALNAATGSWNLSGGTIKGGTITGTGGASLVVTIGTLDGVTLGSNVTVPANGSLTSKNGLTLSNANLILNGNVTAVFTGTQTLGGTGEMLFAGSANATSYVYAQGNNTQAGAAILTIGAGITVHGSQNGQLSGYYNFDSILNQGTIGADTVGRSLSISSNFTNQGMMAADAGSINWTNPSPNTGTIRVGAGGLVSVLGSFTNPASGIVRIEVGGTATSQFGRILVSNGATLDGTLNLAAVNGFSPAIGNTFPVMSFASHLGQFAVVNGLAIGNGNQFSPVYAATNLTLNVIAGGGAGAAAPRLGTPVDTDGDGAPDEQEVAAGTDPQDAASTFRITSVERTAVGVGFTFDTAAGRIYQLEISPDLNANSWTTVTDPITGTGKPVTVLDPDAPHRSQRFYRLVVSQQARR